MHVSSAMTSQPQMTTAGPPFARPPPKQMLREAMTATDVKQKAKLLRVGGGRGLGGRTPQSARTEGAV